MNTDKHPLAAVGRAKMTPTNFGVLKALVAVLYEALEDGDRLMLAKARRLFRDLKPEDYDLEDTGEL